MILYYTVRTILTPNKNMKHTKLLTISFKTTQDTHHDGELLVVLQVGQARWVLELLHEVLLGEVVDEDCSKQSEPRKQRLFCIIMAAGQKDTENG